MLKPTKLQKEVLEVIRVELNFIKDYDNFNTREISSLHHHVYKNIDRTIEDMKSGRMEPKLHEYHADKLSDIMYEIVTFIRDLER